MRVQETTKAGIVLATQSLDKEQLAQTIGTVLAIGTTVKDCPEMDGIGVGDQVLFARYSGTEFPVNGISYRIMRARDVIGKAEKLPDSVIRGAQSSVETFGINIPQAA
jgi:chaperonin GroES